MIRSQCVNESKGPGPMSPPAVANRLPRRLVIAAMAVALSAPALAENQDAETPIGAVYVASNEFAGNRILTFLVSAQGALTPVGSPVATGGLGSGPYWYGPPVTDDPLASSGSLIVDQEGKRLFAVNAGSDEVSAFAVDPGGLTLLDRAPSGGVFPVGLAFGNGTLYVLNAADHSLAVLRVDGAGRMTNLQTVPLPPLPPGGDPIQPGSATRSPQPVNSQTVSQVGLSPDGKRLVVVSKEGALLERFPFPPLLGSGRIFVYEIDERDRTLRNPASPTIESLPSNSQGVPKWPFSFTWSQEGQLLLVEVFGVDSTLAGTAVSSFDLRHDGSLAPISVSVGSGQLVGCWIVSSGTYAYTANYGSDNISSYAVGSNGRVTLANPVAASMGPGFQEFPIDMAVTRDGRFIYQLAPGSALIRPFEVARPTGALSALDAVPVGLDAHSGMAGIATADFRLEMAFDLKPHNLNRNSNGRWVTGYLQPPAPYQASQIDVSSIRLNGVVAVSTEAPAQSMDGGRKLRVQFPRSEVTGTLSAGNHVPVTVTGSIAGRAFIGSDHIRVQDAETLAPRAGDRLAAGARARVAWDAPVGEASVMLLSSMDDGVSWSIEAQDIPNTGSHSWQVPDVSTHQARLGIATIHERDETGVVLEEEYAVSAAFSISSPLGVGEGGGTIVVRAVNPAVGQLTVSFRLATADRASLAAYDVGGRKVATREVGSGGPGWHTAQLGKLPAGIYMVRLSQAGQSRWARAAVIR